jgi:hypothetical protein
MRADALKVALAKAELRHGTPYKRPNPGATWPAPTRNAPTGLRVSALRAFAKPRAVLNLR